MKRLKLVDRLGDRDNLYLSPKALTLAQNAFDQTWVRIAPRFSVDRMAEVRNVVAVAVIDAIRVDTSAAKPLCEAAIRALEQKYPLEMQMELSAGQGMSNSRVG